GLAERHVPDDRIHAVRGQRGILETFADDFRLGMEQSRDPGCDRVAFHPYPGGPDVGRRGRDEHSCATAGLEDPATVEAKAAQDSPARGGQIRRRVERVRGCLLRLAELVWR